MTFEWPESTGCQLCSQGRFNKASEQLLAFKIELSLGVHQNLLCVYAWFLMPFPSVLPLITNLNNYFKTRNKSLKRPAARTAENHVSHPALASASFCREGAVASGFLAPGTGELPCSRHRAPGPPSLLRGVTAVHQRVFL